MPDKHFEVITNYSRVIICGPATTADCRRILAAIHNTVQQRGYTDIVLDFSRCQSIFPGAMLCLVSQMSKYRAEGIDTELVLPSDQKLARLFANTNWAYLIDPDNHQPSRFRGHTQIPAICFRNADEQYDAVNKILEVLLETLRDFSRNHLSAIEWSLNEITDNVINHSQSAIGGLLQLSSFATNRKAVEYVVCDAGVGIPKTLREGHAEISTDSDALDKAIREGVTRDIKLGQGNGLYGSWRITQLSEGAFEIHSGYASLTSNARRDLHVRREAIPFNGTLVVVRINYDRPLILQEALRFRDKPHNPIDFIETRFEKTDSTLQFDLASESKSLGSRASGMTTRQKLLNLYHICPDKHIIIDCGRVALMSSSFADEVFGKLFLEIGPLEFSSRFSMRGLDKLVKAIIDKAILQRMSTGE